VFTPANELSNNDFLAYRFYRQENTVDLTPEEMYFMGLYLAEGSISQISLNVKEIRLTFGLHEKETLVKYFLEKIAPSLNFYKMTGPYECESKGQIQIVINDPAWVERLLKYCGRLSHEVFISPEIKTSPNIKYLLQGHIDGDGHIDCTQRVTECTASEKLARDLFDIITECGYLPSYIIHEHDNENHKDRHQISFSLANKTLCDFGIKKTSRDLLQDKAHAFIYNQKLYCKIRNINIDNFEGIVYNIEVEEDNSYIVNGICVHNCNKNADYFPEEELVKGYNTFLTAKTFKNHENKDVANAIGDVLSAEWDNKMKAVVLFLRIDKSIAPSIVRGFEKGYMTDVSMGCRIDYSLCSICGNKAKVRSEYCNHINTMKHKVFDNGEKVYEINIGPKFHDISAVLNGAEKVAKVTGLYITGDKVAFTMEKAFEKVASIQESIEKEDISIDRVNELIADNLDIPFEKCAGVRGKQTTMQKIAEIKKEIQGRITGLANGEVISDRLEHIDDMRNVLRLLYTKYWSKDKCEKIANYIKEVAMRKNVPIQVAFNEFLQVLDFAGIEISPLEFNDIYHALVGCDCDDMRDLDYPEVGEDFMDSVDENVDEHDTGVDLPSAFNSISGLMKNIPELTEKIRGGSPVKKIKIIIMKSNSPSAEAPDLHEDFMNFLSPMMPERSVHRRFFIKRIANLPEEQDNRAHFMSALLPRNHISPRESMVKKILPMLLYSLYQGDRVRRFNSGDLDFGFNKFASYIEGDTFENILNSSMEKTAGILGKGYTVRKGLVYGLPLTFGYSALQRSRIRNNENVSGLNRYIAENPSNAYVLQAFGGPAALRSLKSGAGKLKVKAKEMSDKIHMGTKKMASDKLYFDDIFKEASIDDKLGMKYGDDRARMLKLAYVYLEQDREDIAELILGKGKLAFSDLDAYLQICKDSIKIEIEKEIEKTANALKEVALGAMAGSAFNSKGTSFLASAPAHIIDAAAITWLANKLSKPKKVPNVKPS
jgi:hypothetical protein